jgi:prolipoprotein diacylglyceryltransferase
MQDISHGVTVLPFEIKIGPLALTGFGIAMLLAFVIGQIVATSELERRRQLAAANLMGDVVVAAVIGGLLGAKIYYAILFHSMSALFERAGFVFWHRRDGRPDCVQENSVLPHQRRLRDRPRRRVFGWTNRMLGCR